MVAFRKIVSQVFKSDWFWALNRGRSVLCVCFSGECGRLKFGVKLRPPPRLSLDEIPLSDNEHRDCCLWELSENNCPHRSICNEWFRTDMLARVTSWFPERFLCVLVRHKCRSNHLNGRTKSATSFRDNMKRVIWCLAWQKLFRDVTKCIAWSYLWS